MKIYILVKEKTNVFLHFPNTCIGFSYVIIKNKPYYPIYKLRSFLRLTKHGVVG